MRLCRPILAAAVLVTLASPCFAEPSAPIPVNNPPGQQNAFVDLLALMSGHRWFGHTLVFAAAALLIVMVGTIGRTRLLRRRLICVPIGIFVGLVLSGAWTGGDAFWWPVLGGGLGHHSLLPATWAVIVEEVVGLVACWWVVGQFDLYLSEVRREFWRTGHLRAAV